VILHQSCCCCWLVWGQVVLVLPLVRLLLVWGVEVQLLVLVLVLKCC
jgi:hypothetical protein